jgi:hypothetical protein
MPNSEANPFEQSWIWLREESAFELSKRFDARNELIHALRHKERTSSVKGWSDASKSPADSRNLSSTRNGTTERSNRCKCSRT